MRACTRVYAVRMRACLIEMVRFLIEEGTESYVSLRAQRERPNQAGVSANIGGDRHGRIAQVSKMLSPFPLSISL